MVNKPNIPLERYKYQISDIILTADDFEDPIKIRKEFVRSISFVSNYDTAVSPKIQLVCQVEKENFEKVILNMNTIIATFDIYKIFVGDIKKSKDLSQDEFEQNHLWRSLTLKAINQENISTEYANKLMNDDEFINEAIDTSQSTVTLTLLLYDHKQIDKYRKSDYFVVKGGKNDIIYSFFANRGLSNIIMSPTDNTNGTYIVPYGHLGHNLKSLNSYYGIYEAPYLFFMDLDAIYLLNKGYIGKTLRQNELQTVSIYLEKESTSGTILTGSYADVDNNMYILNTNNFIISDNDSTIDYAIGGLIKTVVAGSGKIKHDLIGDYDVERTVIVDNDFHSTQLMYNIREQKRNVTLTFTNIDLSIITPNKRYSIFPDETFYNSKYQIKGDYRLSSTMISMIRTNENEFNSSVQICLKKLPEYL